VRLVSVDPGTVTCGVAIYDLDDKFNILSMVSFTIYIDSNTDLDKRMWELYSIFTRLFKDTEPFQLAHESGFINRFRPQAFGPIYTTIYLIRQAFIDTIGTYGLFAYPPKMVKSVISKGTADKNDMLSAVYDLEEVKPFLTGKETEHEIDAIAIGFTHILNIRTYPEVLLF
jgi:Holliday junction resolvasome RuvABC endonuclease subunit